VYKRFFRHKRPLAMNMQKNSTTVYSTEHGRMCPNCGKPVSGCSCGRKSNAPRGDGIVRIGRETKGRKGKGVTVITGVPLDSDGLLELAKQLKQKCGTGGTVKDGVIEIQGDQREELADALTKQGYTVKTIGG
jgi:translation initiation factor 1